MPLPLSFHPALSMPSLLAAPVADALRSLPWADPVQVAPIDPGLADTAQFCQAYGVTPEDSANCVVIVAKRSSVGELRGLHGRTLHAGPTSTGWCGGTWTCARRRSGRWTW